MQTSVWSNDDGRCQPFVEFGHQVHLAIRPDERKERIPVDLAIDGERNSVVEVRGERRIAPAQPGQQVTLSGFLAFL